MTRTEDYAYAVASVRQRGIELLDESDISKLCGQKSKDDAIKFLKESEFIAEDKPPDLSLKYKEKDVFEFLKDVAPDEDMLNFMVVKNDFHNIKAYLKSLVQGEKAERFFIEPGVLEPDTLKCEIEKTLENIGRTETLGAVCAQDGFSALVSNAVEEVYPILTKTLDGQLVDIMLDRKSLNAMIEYAELTGNRFCKEFADAYVGTADIKIALRAKRAGKGSNFLDLALSGRSKVDKFKLTEASQRGMEALKSYIKTTEFANSVAAFEESDADFERYIDKTVYSKLNGADLISFGIEPLVAFYYKTVMQAKYVRMILASIEAGDFENLKERVSFFV